MLFITVRLAIKNGNDVFLGRCGKRFSKKIENLSVFGNTAKIVFEVYGAAAF